MANLINSVAEIKANYAAVDGNMEWDSFESYCQDVERDIIADTAIGSDALNYFIGNLNALDGIKKDVLTRLQRASAYLTVHKWSFSAAFRLTDQALYVTKGKDGAIISDKKLRDLRTYLEETGYMHLDKAIDLMEGNLDQFPAYADSGLRQQVQQAFIRTAADFSRQKSIKDSRVTFMALYTNMLDVQDRRLPDAFGDYYELFKERFLDDELSPEEKKLLPAVKKAIAFLTLAESSDLPLQITGEGIFINRGNGSTDYEQRDPADELRIKYAFEDLRDKGNRKIQELKQYLVTNSILYPDFTPPQIEDTEVNNDCSGIIIF